MGERVANASLVGAAQFDKLATAVIHDNPAAADVFNSPGKNHSDKKYKGPTISSLGVLLRSDKEADLPSLLAFTDALDPDLAKAGSRLNERALVRVLIDITSSFRTPRGWVSSLTNGVWLELCQNRRIRDLHVDILHEVKTGTYRRPAIPPFGPIEAKATFSVFRYDPRPPTDEDEKEESEVD
ncbi:hypothetical protein JG688_00012400 [Phytophthora aleatoria]|uniref:Uncharacterized protein n=1 Tax=Phytophthora aleatoria TaxID=2496075 RepID=A0A8J5J2Z9_9STRA|nr:hypothetical protein JG688_00012400 [Phytophthora aleatoria]